jgi:hypothetical protein
MLDLPEIDGPAATPGSTATATPSAPAATPDNPMSGAPLPSDRAVPRDPNATPASNDSAASTPDPMQEQQRKESRGVQKRIDEITRDRVAAEKRATDANELLSKVLTGLLQPQQAAAAAAADGLGQGKEPKKEQYADYTDYIIAKATFDAEKRLLDRIAAQNAETTKQRQANEQRQQEQRMANAREQLHGVLGAQMNAAVAQFPDYVEVVGSAQMEVPVRVEAAMVSTGAGGPIAYYFAKHPQVMAQLDRLPDMLLGQQVARIAAHMRGNSGASISTAPAPGRPAFGRGGGPAEYPKDATPEQHLAFRKRVAANKGA